MSTGLPPSSLKDVRHLAVEPIPSDGCDIASKSVVVRPAGGVRQTRPDLGQVVHEGVPRDLARAVGGKSGLVQQDVRQSILHLRGEKLVRPGTQNIDQALQRRRDELVAPDRMGLARRVASVQAKISPSVICVGGHAGLRLAPYCTAS